MTGSQHGRCPKGLYFNCSIDLDIDVKQPRYASRQRNRENYVATTVSEYYKLSLTIPLFDMIISEFESRLSKEHRIHGNGFSAVPSLSYIYLYLLSLLNTNKY